MRREFLLRLMVLTVGAHGLFVLATTLLDQLALRGGMHINGLEIDAPIFIGLGLIYLSTLLRRRKRNAWAVALLAYTFMLGFYSMQIVRAIHDRDILEIVAKLALPLIMLSLLALYRHTFTVKSDIESFGYSLRVTLLIVSIAFVYGTVGFMLMDKHDFRREINLPAAAHHTIDQFGLTTSDQLIPHTRRARLFIDSLSVVSVASLTYAVISLFQPIRARYGSHHGNRELAIELLDTYPGKSEDFFKLWPLDKTYYMNGDSKAGLAYKVHRGVALVVGDPFGKRTAVGGLVDGFEDLCYGNDWLPVFVHTEPDWNKFYERRGYSLQKIGEEAIVDIAHFNEHVRRNKYFRQIGNKFARQGYTTEMLMPPHDTALIQRLRIISDDWLAKPGRAERSLLMGYFSEEYLQQCPVVVARDSAGTIQAFLNQIPSYDAAEANLDFLRHSSESLGNINDFVLMAFIAQLSSQGIERLNLGLCPLAGLDDLEEKSVINRALHFVYSNGDRFYSFSGLRRFKAKYEPEWSDRYVVYKGGVRNFVRAMNALPRAMRVKK